MFGMPCNMHYALDYYLSSFVQKKYCIPHIFQIGWTLAWNLYEVGNTSTADFKNSLLSCRIYGMYNGSRFFLHGQCCLCSELGNSQKIKKQPWQVMKGIFCSRTPSWRPRLEIFVKISDDRFVMRFCIHIFSYLDCTI